MSIIMPSHQLDEISTEAIAAIPLGNEDITILTVDDEENNLLILEAHLENEGYSIITASSAEQAWKLLQNPSTDIDIILLDRMMPGMNGIELLEKICNHEKFKHIPVIMQTAAASKEQIVEGINAGAYYYLTKPFDEDMLISVVRAAVHDYKEHQNLREKLKRYKNFSGFMTESWFEFCTIHEARDLASLLASCFPDPDRVILGLSELMYNAVEHGNLEIGYQTKTQLVTQNIWEEEIERRLAQPENTKKRVILHYTRLPDAIELTIKDEGKGFDWEEYMKMSSERATDNHGRGIALANMISFDKLEYIGSGNTVKCTITL